MKTTPDRTALRVKTAIDPNALFPLATAALYPHIGNRGPGIDVNTENGSEYANHNAYVAMGFWDMVEDCKSCFSPEYAFDFGFDFGLELGARIAESHGQLPDIDDLIEKASARIRAFAKEKNLGCRVCNNAQRAGTKAA